LLFKLVIVLKILPAKYLKTFLRI